MGLGFLRMREPGIPQVLTWRWAPCLALALGATSFAAFAMLAIPERIGDLGANSASARMSLGNGFAATQPSPAAPSNWNDNAGAQSRVAPNSVTQVASRAGDLFPKRGFTPPLERAEPPPPPPISPPPLVLDSPTTQVVPPAPQPAAVPPSAPTPADAAAPAPEPNPGPETRQAD